VRPSARIGYWKMLSYWRVNRALSCIKVCFDSLSVDQGLKELVALHDIAKDGVFENKGSAQSSRNLTVTFNILNACPLK